MRLLTGSFLILFLYSCVGTKHQLHKSGITAISYIEKLPLVQGDRQYFDLCDTVSIYYHEDLVAYQLPYTFDSSNTTYYTKSDTIINKHLLTETRYYYFIYKQGSHHGIWYRSVEQLDSIKIIPVDSILKNNSIPINLQSLIFSPNDTLIEKVTFDKGREFIEKYIPRTKPDDSYNDTTLLYYSKAKKTIQFSFSPYLDSLNNAKLYKVRFAFNESYSKTYSITMPQRDMIYEIHPIKITNIENINSLFRRFKQDERRLF